MSTQCWGTISCCALAPGLAHSKIRFIQDRSERIGVFIKKVSVIVPVYNSEAYIEQCIQSLIAQTCQDWEALLIDDGSTDRSLELCKSLSRTDSRIHVYHQENKGAAAARNHGLELAGGEYVAFLDSDDAIHPLLFEEMIRQIEEHGAEMAFCNFIRVDNQQMNAALAKASPQDRRPKWQIGDGLESERWFHIDHAATLCGISGIVSRDLIGTLRFDETLFLGEDGLFKYFLFRKQVRTAYSSQQWYYYRINHQGVCHQKELLVGDSWSEEAIHIRDSEYQRGNIQYAVIWETALSCNLRWRYELCKKMSRKDQCERIKIWALQEFEHPLFRSTGLPYQFLFYLCFKCYPLYIPVSWVLAVVRRLKKKRSGKNR